MPSQKTSLAEYRSARFNPINKDDRLALEIIRQRETQGYSFKKTATEAILRMNWDNIDIPKSDHLTLDKIEKLLSQFAEKLLSRGNETTVLNDRSTIPNSEFVSNFARGFMARAENTHNDDDLQYEDISE